MTPTIQLSTETVDRLERYKAVVGAASDDEAIARLLRDAEPVSAFGVLEGWGPWTPDDRLRARSDDSEV